ncbi:unnamed protein product [Polarella glacialis]|uniref:Nascent polypeptide-associated complex subunit beta n=2 Tax=Polarella glacialis TaxID=89957 RepID=A0A813KPK0_POLGL|nr:unnamed protein product [Polarella glacialis]
MDVSAEVLAARAKLAQRFDAVRTGGKGTMRRTKIAKHANNGADDKQMQAQLKKLGVNAIPGIEEVNMFMESGSVLHFAAPKVQAAVASNTFVISGKGEEKRLEELLPGIISQLGPDNLANLKRIAEGYAAAQGAASKEGEDIPDIGENFEDVSKVCPAQFGTPGDYEKFAQEIVLSFLVSRMSYETADSQKEEFRKYLEKNGIISQLTRVLVGLYEEPERPANSIDYIKKYLGAPTGVDVEELRAENDELKRHNADLESKVASLTQQLKELQTEQDENEG